MGSNKKRKLKVGVFGVGSLGRHHARIYSELPTVDLAGVYDVDMDQARKVAEDCGTRPFGDQGSLVQEIEAASVVVPTDKHWEVGSFLLQKGISILVEKPIAATTAEAEKMVALARKKDVILQVGHVERFNPIMSFFETSLASPRFIEAIRLAPYPPLRSSNTPRGTEVSVVLDLMIHDLDIILHLVRSKPRELHAVGVSVLSPTEDIANVRVAFENGCVANVTASRISQERMRKIRVFQKDKYVSLDYVRQAGQICYREGTSISATDVPIEKGDPLTSELSSFVDCVVHKKDPIVTGAHAAEALKLAVQICEAIRNNPS